jgi:hypothetical protein
VSVGSAVCAAAEKDTLRQQVIAEEEQRHEQEIKRIQQEAARVQQTLRCVSIVLANRGGGE